MFMLILLICGVGLIIMGSIGVNYHNRLKEHAPNEVKEGEFGYHFSIGAIVTGCLAIVAFVIKIIITIKSGGMM